jgi:hypothetical protein
MHSYLITLLLIAQNILLPIPRVNLNVCFYPRGPNDTSGLGRGQNINWAGWEADIIIIIFFDDDRSL